MIRIILAAAATFAVLWLVGFSTMLATGCTEPGQCSAVGEFARDRGSDLAVAIPVAVLAVGIALHLLRARKESRRA